MNTVIAIGFKLLASAIVIGFWIYIAWDHGAFVEHDGPNGECSPWCRCWEREERKQ